MCMKTIDKHGKLLDLAAVPPLWAQLCKLDWQAYDTSSIRYFTNSGGALTLGKLSCFDVKRLTSTQAPI